jgi:hypothetical protein
MDLLSKSIIAAVIIALIIVGIYIGLQKIAPVQQITSAQAVSLIKAYLQNSYPTAEINITNVTPSTYSGSWHITASTVLNASKPCPTYYISSFDYPKYGFVNTIQNTYTKNCIIYGIQNTTNYLITSSPVAITKSYTLGIPSIISYVNKYGYSNIYVSANYYKNTTIFYKNFTDVWIVNYTAPTANYSSYVMISQHGGSQILNYTISH